ncbi:MAG: hypothetical protein JXA68_02425 [Ignavibacteriales bacterium]|nr:hypothetical protein [Ignavibacteriales bacterium]
MTEKLVKTLIIIALIAILFSGCEKNDGTEPDEVTNQQALEELVTNDDVLKSYDVNFNEETAMNFAKTETAIYPIRVGRRVTLVSRNLNITFSGDSASGLLTSVYDGILYIAASYNSAAPGDTSEIDTIIQKPFTTTVTRNLKFKKIANTSNPKLNWRLTEVSLPEGQTATTPINITKLVVGLSGGDSLVVTNPNTYYFKRDTSLAHTIPIFGVNQNVKVKIELTSTRSDTDFVTLTWGASYGYTMHRAKKRFVLKSSTLSGGLYYKVYEQTYTTNYRKGFKHAIFDAVQRPVILDDAVSVQHNAWGIPYVVK